MHRRIRLLLLATFAASIACAERGSTAPADLPFANADGPLVRAGDALYTLGRYGGRPCVEETFIPSWANGAAGCGVFRSTS